MSVRRLRTVDAAKPLAVRDALAAAMAGAGPPILPRPRPASDRPVLAAEGGERLGDEWPGDACLVIETSGSTASPKRVVLSTSSLRASGLATERRLDARRDAADGPAAAEWMLCLPAEYVAGAQVLARSILAGTEPVIASPGSFDPLRFARDAGRMRSSRRRTSLVPAQLLRLVEAAEGMGAAAAGADGQEAAEVREAIARFDAILVGGQSTPPQLRERAAALGWRLVTTYGASETSGGCVYNGVPLDGVEARVVEGEVWLAGDVLAAGYLGDPDRTASSFVLDDDGRRWYRTGDGGTVKPLDAQASNDGRQRIAITGRLDNVIISGGEKVLLDRVERLVRSVAGYEDAVVVGVPSERWGEVPVVILEANNASLDPDANPVRVDAATTLDGDEGWATVRDAAAAAGRAAKPAHRIRISETPRLVSGKPDRRALGELAARALANGGERDRETNGQTDAGAASP